MKKKTANMNNFYIWEYLKIMGWVQGLRLVAEYNPLPFLRNLWNLI